MTVLTSMNPAQKRSASFRAPPRLKPFVAPACPGNCTTAYRSSPASASNATLVAVTTA